MTTGPLSLALATATLALGAQAATPGAPAASAPQAAASGATPRARVACADHAASGVRRATSKLRHVPDEDDPCAESRGLAAPAPR